MAVISQLRVAGCYGLMIEDWSETNIGDMYTINGKEFMVTAKESLSKMTDGIYAGRPAWIQLRGFNPETDL